MLLVLFRRQPRLIVTTDGIIRIPTEAITIVIATRGIITSISTAGITIGTGVGLSASVGVQDTIAIGKRIDARGRLRVTRRESRAIFDSKRSVCRNWA